MRRHQEHGGSGIVWLDDPNKYPHLHETPIVAPFRSRASTLLGSAGNFKDHAADHRLIRE
jgi:hypothetical protein